MTASEAIVYSLGCTQEENGELRGRFVYDKNSQPHWISWLQGVCKFNSESPTPFSKDLEPYFAAAD